MKKEDLPKKEGQSPRGEFNARLFENETWITTCEVMAYLKISRSTLYRLRKKHNIPSFKLGGIPVFPKRLLNKLFIRRALDNVDDKNK
ncbi:helix-turn-helix domain-containing protein [Polaribacter uvawellassae]|uniref:helix-turn-helix domain-containing protein n=1 Tax=Polaribacter uvawellassae TaxID=3133495 RepID=UPI00321A0CED